MCVWSALQEETSELTQIRFSVAETMHIGGWTLQSTTQKTKHKRGFSMFELPE